MPDIKKMKLELPEGMELPEGCELPEIKVASASIRKTIIQDDGNMTEVEEVIEVPIME